MGTYTPQHFFFKPALGARGYSQKNLFDLGMDQVDARLAKENMLKTEKDYERTRELFQKNLESLNQRNRKSPGNKQQRNPRNRGSLNRKSPMRRMRRRMLPPSARI